MHAYIATRGIKHEMDRFINELSAKYVPFKYPNKIGKLEIMNLLFSVRPIQLFELVFPEEHKDIVLNTIFRGNSGNTQHKKHQKFIWAARKMLGVEPIPKYKTDQFMPIFIPAAEIIGIGIKKDYWINIKTGEHIKNPTEEQKKECYEGI